MATTEDHSGVYVKLGDYIALRDNDERSWRLSRVVVGVNSTLHLELIGSYDHLWRAREYVQRAEETVAGVRLDDLSRN